MTAAGYVKAVRSILATGATEDTKAMRIAGLKLEQRSAHVLSIKEAGSLFGVDRRTIFRWIAAKKLPVIVTPGGRRVIDVALCPSNGNAGSEG
ncbi:MAG TPA: helix-turn-helix domain-containing protein [Candidatus Methylacidiphilales bacterium]